jgi:hypothetical protein
MQQIRSKIHDKYTANTQRLCIKIHGKYAANIRQIRVNTRGKHASKGAAIVVLNSQQIFYVLYREFCRDVREKCFEQISHQTARQNDQYSVVFVNHIVCFGLCNILKL